MARSFTHRMSEPYGPGHSGFAITPHATNPLQQNGEDVICRAIYVGVGGDIQCKVATESGSAATLVLVGVPTGTVLNLAFTHVLAASTTATNLIGFL